MSTPHAKRRRLNDATTTLKKPFKSPFRTPLRPNIGSDPPSSDPPDVITPARLTSYTTSFTTPGGAYSASPQREVAPATPAPPQPRFSNPITSRPTFSTPSRCAPKKASSNPSLTRELMQLRNEIQILTQARTLATSTKDEDLQTLIEKWRTASRAAAEELFGSTRDRVNGMGGVGAWKEREKEAKERTMKWDLEEREAEREKIAEARENGEIGDEAYDKYAEMADEQGQEEEEDDVSKAADDDSFTMDMMLKTLNIDLELIGYSKEAQRWDGQNSVCYGTFNMSLQNQNVLITGASMGIGATIAQRLARESANLILFARSEDKLKNVAQECRKTNSGIKVHVASVDVSNHESLAKAVSNAVNELGPIDVLINNAGLALGAPNAFPDLKVEEINTMAGTNISGFMFATYVALNEGKMKERNKGTILNVTSTTALEVPPFAGEAVYHASKAFQEAFSNVLRTELVGTDIKVLCLRPGVVATNFHEQRVGYDKGQYDSFMDGFEPLVADDVAEGAVFMLSQKERISVKALDIVPTAQRSLQVFDKKWNERGEDRKKTQM
ncbi:hypothetical protein N0V95_004321 [Ascochyta clinopodiicola]|nr:hypothetical protein N0V95_004321 [Ascochyta clinopodiicola]